MFNKSYISILCLLTLFDPFIKLDVVFAGGNKNFFGGGGKDDGDKALQTFESSFGGSGGGSSSSERVRGKSGKAGKGGKAGSSTAPKYSHTDGIKLFDEFAAAIFPLGDKNGGLPESPAAMAKYCVEFTQKGSAILAYIAARYPQKLIVQTMASTGSMGLIKLNAVYCANPISILHYTEMAKLVNSVNEELVKIKNEFSIRSLNSYTKIDSGDEKQKHSCCAYIVYKKKTVEAVPDDAKEFVKTMLESHFNVPQRIFCQDIQDDTFDAECGKIEFIDDDPEYPITRGLYTAPFYVITQFV